MLAVSGYEITQKLYESDKSLVYRALRTVDRALVILKVLKEEFPSLEELRRYQQEYRIICKLTQENRDSANRGAIAAYALETHQKRLVIVLEDFGAISLKQWMQGRSTLKEKANGGDLFFIEFLQIAIAIAESLGQIHAVNVIHRDINPSNIVYNPDTGCLKIIDFGISSELISGELIQESQSFKQANVLEGTLPYMSPEQTGRMNRSLDYRTDFYSLGVTLYELLTSRLPFDTEDTLELVHSHLAKLPLSPMQVNVEIPAIVSDIVMKLLAKNAEERYESAWGLKSDLENCLTQLQQKGRIAEFPLASQDISNRFQIPEKLYGREKEAEILLNTFKQISAAQNSTREKLILIAGYAGIGKSSLVRELYKPISERQGYFISGKFDRLQQGMPYSAIAEALEGLIQQLLAEPEAQLQQWREQISKALGANGQILVDIIPNLERIVGKQSQLAEVNSAESQNRFHRVFQNFIRMFCSDRHPFVMFLDDLQWADSASLKLIELLVDSDIPHWLCIGAYRDSLQDASRREVDHGHPLCKMLEVGLQRAGGIRQIVLEPLKLEAVTQLIAETFHTDIPIATPLAKLVMDKTGGNPFFVGEFFRMMYAENLITLTYSGIKPQWQWDIAQIEAKAITENVVELAIARIQKLPESTQQVLRLAACIGTNFDLETLATICERSPELISSDLMTAVRSLLILAVSELEDRRVLDYKFQHDRIQQAAYALLSEAEKIQAHQKIGLFLLKSTPSELLSTKIFDIVNQLNRSSELCIESAEKNELARLNLIAGLKARSLTAYASAFTYFSMGSSLLAANSWRQDYDLTLAMYAGLVETAYLSGNYPEMERLAEIVLREAKLLLDKVKIYQIKIQAAIAQNKFAEAIAIALDVLAMLGIEIPKSPSRWDVWWGAIGTKLALFGKKTQSLMHLPKMTNPNKRAAMATIASVCTPTYFTRPDLWQLMVFQKIQLSLRYGNAPGSAFGYADYGMVLCGAEENFDQGFQFARLASELMPKLNAKEFLPKTLLLVNLYLIHWKGHLRDTLDPLLASYQIGLEMGDLDYGTAAIAFRFYHAYLVGSELAVLEREMASYTDVLLGFNRSRAIFLTAIYRQAILNLLGQSQHPCRLIGESYNEEEKLPIHTASRDNSTLFHLYLNKLILHYLFCEYSEAGDVADRVKKLLADGAVGLLVVPVAFFYDSLAKLAIFPTVPKHQKRRILREVSSNQRKMKLWANHAPMNYAHKFHLVEAERDRILGQNSKATDAYDRAIALAQDHGYLQEEALAHELAARFYLNIGKPKIALVYMRDARFAYQKWGAIAKVAHLERLYPQLLDRFSQVSEPTSQRSPSHRSTGRTNANILDLASVLKASQTLSGEMMLGQLIMKLMKILLENAGAEKGYLILASEGALLVEAEGIADRELVTVLQSVPIDEFSEHLSVAMITQVARTQESVILNNPSQKPLFSHDPYIIKHQPMSVLCAPLVNQGKLSGVLYVENNLAHDAFTPERVEVLQLLSTQAAIAIENARLYQNLAELNQSLEMRVQERTSELSQANQQLQENEQTILKALEMEREANLLKTNFISMVSHEFRNPMMTITGCVRSLQNPKRQLSDDRKTEYLMLIQESLSDMLHLLDEVLLLGRSEAGVLKYEPRPTNLEQFCHELLTAFNLNVKEGQAIIFSCQGECQAVEMDTTLMRHIFANLLSNAIKYSPEGGQIYFDLVCADGMARFQVRDCGIGIPPSDRDRLFETFHRASNVGQIQGTGLGLAIVKQCTTLHQGAIDLESEVNVGTTVTIELPLNP
ncbi:ATP-binding sensor histidine kinase [Tumidithrix elongata RA019]|uniref:histidine kinase n=1 Tax=Tumidithrix elongata BACA0141 TaxID=2716417 RepID=A0AAW9Q3W1_9CYAN|nr:ATP-binding sensor histidine kinase [Tumidithrix elongata RA019]